MWKPLLLCCLGNLAGSAAWQIPYGGPAVSAAARTVVVNGVYTAADIASSVRAKDELTVEVRLQPPGAAARVSKTVKKKASSDGDDILTPALEAAAGAVIVAATKT